MREPVKIGDSYYTPLNSYTEFHSPSDCTLAAKEHFQGRKINILEIGVLRGHHALVMYEHLNPKLMLLVDPWDMFGEETHDSNWADTWYKMQGKPEVVIMKATSEVAASLVSDSIGFDFIYIDGDHTPQGFNLDLELWTPFVTPGGIIAGHDFNFPNIEVEVRRVFEGYEIHSTAKEDRTIGGEEWWVIID